MKNILKISITLILFTLTAHAQHYVYQKIEGASPHMKHLGDRKTILEGPANERLSLWQKLPFKWTFYGRKVDGYYASENGYITFDSTATSSDPNHVAIPGPSGPNNAIYACWGDWELIKGRSSFSRSINTVTSGTSPNRIHLISWIGLSPVAKTDNSRSVTNMFLILHEQGGFEILMNVSIKTTVLPTTVGTENGDGTRATMVGNSPSFEYPPLKSNANDDITYKFEYVDRRYQGRIIDTNLDPMAAIGKPQMLSANLWNMGSEPIKSFTANYSIDGDIICQQSIEGVNVPTNEIYNFSYDKSWKPENVGRYTKFDFWVSNINETGLVGNENPLKQQTFVNLGKTAEKKVLIEEFTGTWCGWCPDGMVQIKDLMGKVDNVFAVAIHANHADSMVVKEGQELADTYSPAYPESLINRTLWPREGKVPISRNEEAWYEKTQKSLSEPAPVQVLIDPHFDPKNRMLSVEITAKFVDYAEPGDLRLNLLIVEDNVTGEGKGYDQANFYSGHQNYVGYIYYDKPKLIKGYPHPHVLRAVLSGAWGTEGVIPEHPLPGSRYSRTYSYRLPENFNEHEVSLVAFVSYFGEELKARRILNVEGVKLFPKGKH